MRHCPSCGGIVGRDCFNPVECAQISEQQATQHDQDHYRIGFHEGYKQGYAEATQSPCPDLEREKAKAKELVSTIESVLLIQENDGFSVPHLERLNYINSILQTAMNKYLCK